MKRGDTLWGIASMFLRDPWLWPEVWYINPQVANPHLIYPGDTLALAYGKDGKPQIRLEQGGAARLDPRLRSSPLDGAIPTIPYTAIAAFLSRPSVLTNEQVRNAATRGGIPRRARRCRHRPRGLHRRPEGAAQHAATASCTWAIRCATRTTARSSVMRASTPRPRWYRKPGNPTKALLIDTARETLQGDKVLAADLDVPLNFMLRAPRNDVHGRIIAVVDGTEVIGQYQIVVINRGKRHGIDAGHVLAVDQAGQTVHDVYANEQWLHARTSAASAPPSRPR